MGLKILHSADWHLDTPFADFSEPQRQRLQEAQSQIPNKIAELCRRENCDLMLLAGDLFEGKPRAETLVRLKEALRKSGVPVLIAPGDFDFCQPGSPWLEDSWPENVYIFRGDLESVSIAGLDCRIYGAAYQGKSCPGLLENFTAHGEERYRIALLHGDPTQPDSPCCPITASQVRQSGLHYLALGHLHKAGAFRSGDTLCVWPGCPMGRNWEESGEKGVCIVTLGDRAEVQALSLDTIRFHDLEVNIGNDAHAALESVLPSGGSQDFFRITLGGYGTLNLKSLRPQFHAFPNLKLVDNTLPPMALWGNADRDSLEGIYFQMLHDLMEQDTKHADEVRLAAEISRKLLSGKEIIL